MLKNGLQLRSCWSQMALLERSIRQNYPRRNGNDPTLKRMFRLQLQRDIRLLREWQTVEKDIKV